MDAPRDFDAFRRRVAADAALACRLGNERDHAAFAAAAVRLGEANGFTFTIADVEAALRAGRRAWLERRTE